MINFCLKRAQNMIISPYGPPTTHVYITIILFKDSSSFSVMDILQEFLETSTIHGLTYISTAKVGATFFCFFILFPIDLVGKDPVVWSCHTWVYGGWIPNWPVLP